MNNLPVLFVLIIFQMNLLLEMVGVGRNKQKCLFKILQVHWVFFFFLILDQHLWQDLEASFFFYFKKERISVQSVLLLISRVLRSSLQKMEIWFLTQHTTLFRDLSVSFICLVILGVLLILSLKCQSFHKHTNRKTT